ncbi:hypothetical protein [uncultured Luteimonas sp.]|uniref:hypothetical protein n=1 Tax=uncultured Luteimonas sp. TaxID=453144 RepID=UPI0026323B71|nr:hypothetical protein [uncultured Luteimonas sp.]
MIPLGILAAADRSTAVPPPAGSTFDPALKGASIALSNGNLDATKAGSGYQTVYTTQGRSAGVYAFEMLMPVRPSLSAAMVGIADKTNSGSVIGTYLGTSYVETLGLNDDSGSFVSGRIYRRMTVGNTSGGGTSRYEENDVVTVKVDFGVNQLTGYVNGVQMANLPIAVTSGKTYYPAASLQNGVVIRFRPTGLTYLPAGATEWG